jgi:hypothetical protein
MKEHYYMRLFSIFLVFAGVVMLLGCSKMFRYNYGVAFRNIGTKRIWVEEFELFKDKPCYSSVGCGILVQNANASSYPYYKKPYSEVEIQWQFMSKDLKKIGEVIKHTVKIDLPKEFSRKHGREIIFYINPDENKVYVAYKITTKDGYKEINSDGTPFQLPTASENN